MPTKRKDAKEAKATEEQKSDAEIIKDRRSVESFGSADSYLGYIGWALWALAAAWLFCFSASAPPVSELHGGVADPLLGGGLCLRPCPASMPDPTGDHAQASQSLAGNIIRAARSGRSASRLTWGGRRPHW
ncbi:unnamed protein product [Prorocentrum cordatum]|uniref:Uncharacterized protein n=1 Tax=Prorocentrum cordatum TaxID=2364126 RepID=A0ABN9QQ41_9DINO|nr:unnamed protein product [Polarella glacialis]